MTKPRPKKHHYVPQLHLRQFTGSKPHGMVWTYDKQGNEPRASLPKETGAESNLYSVRGPDGQYNDEIELWLSDIESRAKPGYEQLLRGEIPSASERADFAAFLASLHVRTPTQLRKVGETIGKLIQARIDGVADHPERFQSVYNRIPGAEKIDLDRARKAVEFARDPTSHELLIARDATLQALRAADGLQAIFCQMGWAILDSERNPFITSDHPVLKYIPGRRPHPIHGDGGFFNERVEVSFPLSPSRCLILWHRAGRMGITGVGREIVFNLNRLQAAFAERYIYSHEKSAGIAALTAKYATSRDRTEVAGRGENKAPVRVVRRLTRV